MTATSGCFIAARYRRSSASGAWPASSCSDASTMSNCCEDAVGEIETAVGQDVDLAAVEDGDVGIPLAEAGDLLGLALDAVDRQVRDAAERGE